MRIVSKYFYLSLVVASSCYKVPDYLLETVPEPICLHHSIDKALHSKRMQEGPWPEANWWEWFDDSQLTELISEGLEKSPDLKKAELRVSAALGIADQIRSRLFPHLNFFFQENYQHLSAEGYLRKFAFRAPPPEMLPPEFRGVNFTEFATPVPAVLNVLDLGFSLDWSLDLFGKNRYQWTAMLGEAKAAEGEAKQIRLILSSQIAQAYFTLQTHQMTLKLYQEMIGLKKRLELLMKKRERIGLDTKLETIASQINLAELEKLVFDLSESILLDRNRLFVLMGLSPDTEREITFRFQVLDKAISVPKEISSNFLARRPDIMAEIWRVERAAAEIGAAKAQFYPEINLRGLLSLRSVFPSQLFTLNPSSAENSLLPIFTLPIFNGGKLKANLREKLNLFEMAVHSYHETLLKSLREVSDLLKQVETNGSKLEVQQKISVMIEMQKELKDKRYRAGVDTAISMIEFEIESLSKTTHLVQLQSDQILYAIKLMQALGGGYLSIDDVPEKFTQLGSDGQ